MTAHAEHIAALENAVAAVLAEHGVRGFCGDSTLCECGRTWLKNAAYRAHLTDALLPLFADQAAENRRLRTKAANLTQQVRQLRAMRDARVAWVPLVTFGERAGCGT